MNVDRQVIIDLLPVYFSGEASAPTRALVEEYFREDPELERIARNANRPLESLRSMSADADAEKEKQSLVRTRNHLRTRNIWRTFAIVFCLVPFSFAFEKNQFQWIMLRDSPQNAVLFALFGIACWVMFFVHGRRTKTVGI